MVNTTGFFSLPMKKLKSDRMSSSAMVTPLTHNIPHSTVLCSTIPEMTECLGTLNPTLELVDVLIKMPQNEPLILSLPTQNFQTV